MQPHAQRLAEWFKQGEAVHWALAELMNASSAGFAHGVDEMHELGLGAAPCRCVAVSRVAEAPAALECKLLQIVSLRDLDGNDTDHHVAFGQVVGVHIDPDFLRDGLFDTGAAAPIQRAGYLTEYAAVDASSMRHLTRPSTPDEARGKRR